MVCDCCRRRKKLFESFAAIETEGGAMNLCVDCNDLAYKIRDDAHECELEKYNEHLTEFESRGKKATPVFKSWKEKFLGRLEERMTNQIMSKETIFEMPFSKIYPLLVKKAVRKGRTKAEVDEVITWLTGYSDPDAASDKTCRSFFEEAPEWNPSAEKIKGTICGIRIEEIDDPLMKRIRQLDKLVDELAKGKPLKSVLK